MNKFNNQFFYIFLITILTPQIFTFDKNKLLIMSQHNKDYESEDKLLFVFQFMRHGARSPSRSMSKNLIDIFGQKWDGNGEITEKGYYQLYKMGLINRERYKNLLNFKVPFSYEIYAYSSISNRTLMTANAILQGMYTDKKIPVERQLTIPVHNIAENLKGEIIPVFYFTDKSNCKKWTDSFKVNFMKKNFINYENTFFEKYKNLFDYLEKSNVEFKKIEKNTKKIKVFCDNFISNYYDGRKIKLFTQLKYTDEQLYNLYLECHELSLKRYTEIYFGYEVDYVSTIVISEYLRKLINYMDNIINNPEFNPKFVLYSGHQSTVASMELFLKRIFNVPYDLMFFGTHQDFLLYKEKNSEKYLVKYFYDDKLKLSMEYSEFRKKVMDNTVSKEDTEFFCQTYTKVDYIILGLCCGIVILFIFIINIFRYFYVWNKKRKFYLSEENNPSISQKEVNIKVIN